MSDNILFDNLLITDDIVVAQEVAAVTFDSKRKQMELESVRLKEIFPRIRNKLA